MKKKIPVTIKAAIIGAIITGIFVLIIKFIPDKKTIKAINKDVTQTATGDNITQVATTGDNSPIIIDNRKEILSNKIKTTTLSYNEFQEDFFVTKVELYSQHPIPNVYFAAHAKTIVEFDVSHQRAGVYMIGHSGRREDFWFTNIPNFGGKYLLVVKTKESEKVKIEIQY